MSARFGIIGFGFMGQIHEEVITQKVAGAEVVAICDVVAERMDNAVTPGVRKCACADELLAMTDVDVALIVVPNHLHKEMVIKAARAGKDILCEKPAAMTTEEFDEMMTEVDRCGVHFTVHQQRRFDKDFQTIKRAYDERLVGKPYTIQSKLYGYNGNMHDWHIYQEYGGGMLLDWGVHLIDQILWMLGSPVKTVFADVRNVVNAEVDDYFLIHMRFENGMSAVVELGTYFLRDESDWYTHHMILAGSEGTAYCDDFSPNEGKLTTTRWLLTSVADGLTMTKSGPTRSFGTPPEGLLDTKDLPCAQTEHIEFFRNYLEARNGREDFLVKRAEVRDVLRIMDAARLSAKTGRSIEM